MTGEDQVDLHEWTDAHGSTLDAIAHDTGVTREDVRYLAVLVIVDPSDDQIVSSWKTRHIARNSTRNPFSSVEHALAAVEEPAANP